MVDRGTYGLGYLSWHATTIAPVAVRIRKIQWTDLIVRFSHATTRFHERRVSAGGAWHGGESIGR